MCHSLGDKKYFKMQLDLETIVPILSLPYSFPLVNPELIIARFHYSRHFAIVIFNEVFDRVRQTINVLFPKVLVLIKCK